MYFSWCCFLLLQSLYPYVLKSFKFPTCHPVILKDAAKIDHTLNSYFGLVKCTVLAPTDLFLPLLPFKTAEKLMFPLCGDCAMTLNQNPCSCKKSKRAMLGTWTTFELKKALQLGYKILQIHEVYHYPETTSPPEEGLFQVNLLIYIYHCVCFCKKKWSEALIYILV